MFLKKCPFCNEQVCDTYDTQKKLFVISCPACARKGIIVNVSDKDMLSLQKKWNTRKFDDILTENPEQTIKDLLAYKQGDMSLVNTKYNIEQFDRDDFGWLIMDNLDVIKCIDSHPEELFRYFGLENDGQDFDYEKFCIENGIIRIGVLKRCCFIMIPMVVTHEQITKTLEILANEDKPDIVKYYVELYKKTSCKEDREMVECQSLNEVYLLLDKVA